MDKNSNIYTFVFAIVMLEAFARKKCQSRKNAKDTFYHWCGGF